MSDHNENNTFYLSFKDVHPSWSLIGCALSFGIIATFGIIFNFCVIFVTIRSKSLHGTINYLLALYSVFELLHQHGHFLFVYVALSGQNFIEFRLAVKILSISLFGIGALFPTMFFTAIDRLIGIVFSEIHDKFKIRIYLASITTICVLISLHGLFLMYQTMDLYSDQMVTGFISDLVQNSTVFLAISGLILVTMTIIIYLIVGIVIRIKSAGLPSAQSINQRTFRALFCIIAVNIGGYLISLSYKVLIKPSITSPITDWFCQAITTIALNIGAASSAPILYFTSTDYREAFQKQLPFVFKRRITNQIAPITIVVKSVLKI